MAKANTSEFFQGVTVEFQNAAGEKAAVEGTPVWASSDETILSVKPSPDGFSADVFTVAIGTARISVTGDADLGAGFEPVVLVSEDVEVVMDPAGKAVAGKITFGAPVPKVA